MDPLALLFGFLGAGGLAALLKIILGYSAKTQETSRKAMADMEERFERFLGNHMSEQVRAMENLVEATERLGDRLSGEHEKTRAYIKEQAKIVRDGHRKMGQLLQASRPTAKVGRVLDEVITGIEEKDPNGR